MIEGVQSPVSTSKGDLSPQQDSGWKLDPQAELLKCVNLYNAEGRRSVSPTSPTELDDLQAAPGGSAKPRGSGRKLGPDVNTPDRPWAQT